MIITTRRLGLIAAAAIVFAACGSSDNDSATDATPAATDAPAATSAADDGHDGTADGHDGTAADGDDMAGGDAMALPEFASGFSLALTSDADGGVVTDNEVTIEVEATGYELSCSQTGKEVNDQAGHYHLLLDNSLVDMRCVNSTSVSMQNVAPGEHTIAVVPALNNHAEVMDNMAAISFDYEPTSPLAEIGDQETAGDPTITIVSPQPGETVTGDFDLVFEIENFELSCDLYGKPGLLGIGHLHVNLDTTDGPMMGMSSLLGMGCDNTFTVSTEGLAPGSTHTLIARLADNGHAPLMNAAPASVEVTIG